MIKLFCEGSRTEHDYFNALKRLPSVRDASSVEIRLAASGGNSPMTLVDKACAAKANEAELDEVWCVYDVEAKADKPGHHPHLEKARVKARDNDVELAVSNPCFELWLILHLHADPHPTAFLTTPAAESLRRALDASSGKEVDAAKYVPHLALAKDRAEQLERKHTGDQTMFPANNPSSTVFRLLTAVGL